MKSLKRVQTALLSILMAACVALPGLTRPVAANDTPPTVQARASIESVTQEGRVITPEEFPYGHIASQAFTVNDSQDIIVKLRFEDIGDYRSYWFMTRDAFGGKSFTKAEMLEGIELNIYGYGYGIMDDGYKYATNLSFVPSDSDEYPYGVMNRQADLYYDNQRAALHIVRDASAKTLSASLSDEVKQQTSATSGTFISPLNHDADHPIILTVKGVNFAPDEDYEITIRVIADTAEDSNAFFRATRKGSEINTGTDVTLAGLVLHFSKPGATTIEGLGGYSFIVQAGGITNRDAYANLSYGDFDVALFYGNGERNSTTLGAGGNINFVDRELLVNKALFEEYGHIYLYPYSSGFPADATFQYEIYYGNNIDWLAKDAYATASKIASQTITGAELNNGAKPFKLERQANDEKPCYAVLIKHDDETVAAVVTSIEFVEGESLTTMNFSASDDRQIYYNYGDGFSLSTNGPATAHIKGHGYDDEKTYKLKLVEEATYLLRGEHYGEIFYYAEKETLATKTIDVTGADLNAGRVTHRMDKIAKTENLHSHNLYARVLYDDGQDEGYIPGREIYAAFMIVEPRDYFSADNPYNFDNVSDYIKGVGKRTTIDDFATKMGAEGSNHVTIYDASNQAVSSGNIGTGMTARLEDQYDRPLMDMSVVVTGDLNGDGDITITDLVTEARALAELVELSGVYKSAGDVTGTGGITITDLVKVSRDIAGIEEII